MYNLGMYGGSFNPLHIGHVRCITKALTMCKKLLIVISDSKRLDDIDAKIKYRWIYQLTKHLDVSIMILPDECASKSDYTKEMALADAEKVKSFAGQPIDVVFCGSDYDESSFWNFCYPNSDFHVFPRDEVNSTMIRQSPYKFWDWIPDIVRPLFVKKVLIVGSESTGKSTLTINLAHYYNTVYIEEAGRTISTRSGCDAMMIESDFTDILLTHKQNEIKGLATANRILFEDTDCLTTLFYLGFLDIPDNNVPLAQAINKINNYDLILFLEPDVEFFSDGRNVSIGNNRDKYSQKLKDILLQHGKNFISISGDYNHRFEQSVKLIDQLIK